MSDDVEGRARSATAHSAFVKKQSRSTCNDRVGTRDTSHLVDRFKLFIHDSSFDGHGLGRRDDLFRIGSFACT